MCILKHAHLLQLRVHACAHTCARCLRKLVKACSCVDGVVQALAQSGGSEVLSGSSHVIGDYSCSAAVSLTNATGASAHLVSVPFKDIHKTHDLAKQLIVSEYRKYMQNNGGQPPPTLSIGDLAMPGANMVLLQVLPNIRMTALFSLHRCGGWAGSSVHSSMQF